MATDEEILAEKQIIIMELSEHDAVSGMIAPNIDALWNSMTAKSNGDLELQTLLVKRRAIDILIGSNWRNSAAPLTDNRQSRLLLDPVSVLRLMRENTQNQIESHASIGRINIDWVEADDREF